MNEDIIYILEKTLKIIKNKNRQYNNSHEKTIYILKIMYEIWFLKILYIYLIVRLNRGIYNKLF